MKKREMEQYRDAKAAIDRKIFNLCIDKPLVHTTNYNVIELAMISDIILDKTIKKYHLQSLTSYVHELGVSNAIAQMKQDMQRYLNNNQTELLNIAHFRKLAYEVYKVSNDDFTKNKETLQAAIDALIPRQISLFDGFI